MTVFHEAHACLINKISAFSPQSFGEKQGGVLSTVQSRRVELHELHVPQARTGPEGHSIPIPRRHIRVRGVGEELPGPSRSQHCGPGQIRRQPPILSKDSTPTQREPSVSRSPTSSPPCSSTRLP